MSTLPFLLSVADELDNINSQSYMDDFGLGFHPHRQYYRSPNIQLSLPASTDWIDKDRHRYRPHRFVLENQNNLQAAAELEEEDEAGNGASANACTDNTYADSYADRYGGGGGGGAGAGALSSGASTSAGSRQKYVSALNSNNTSGTPGAAAAGGGGAAGRGADSGVDGDADNIDNSVKRYHLTKKCCKSYYRRGDETAMGGAGKEKSSEGGYRLHSKCMEGNNSSSDESLQKVSSSIEFLTCFLVKKSRAPKNAAGGASGKKS